MPVRRPTPRIESDHAAATHAARGARRLRSSSGGHAGVAVADAGRQLILPLRGVVPATAGERAKAVKGRPGAEVGMHGRSWHEANDHLATLRGPGDAFRRPAGMAGPRHVACRGRRAAAAARRGGASVGGGGSMCGVLQGLHAAGWHDVPLVAVKTRGADSLHAAVAAGRPVTLPAITSLATPLGVHQVGDAAFEWTRRHEVQALTVNADEAVPACLDVADERRLIVEAACGVAIAAIVQRQPRCCARRPTCW